MLTSIWSNFNDKFQLSILNTREAALFACVVEASYVCAIAIWLFKFFLICLWIGRLECVRVCLCMNLIPFGYLVDVCGYNSLFRLRPFHAPFSSFSCSLPIWNAPRKSFGITYIVVCFLVLCLEHCITLYEIYTAFFGRKVFITIL